MKRSCLFNVATAALFALINLALPRPVAGQGQGSFRFVDAAGIPDKVFLTVDAAKLKPEGFSSGDTTGAIGILAGPHRISVSNPTHGNAQVPISVQSGASITVIAYCRTTVDPTTRRQFQTLQLLPRPNPPLTRGKQFQLLYISDRPSITLTINGQNRVVSALREVPPAELPTGQVKIESGGQSIVNFDAPQAGNFLVVIFDDQSGKPHGVVVPDYS